MPPTGGGGRQTRGPHPFPARPSHFPSFPTPLPAPLVPRVPRVSPPCSCRSFIRLLDCSLNSAD
eukprot:2224695-Pyramimonas_sp.AAC.1